MIRLILMRHGNTFEKGQVPVQIGARTDLPLTLHGRKQAEALAAFCPAVIYTGPLKRQVESAQIIAEKWGLAPLVESALTEIDYGVWEGLSAEEIAEQFPKESDEWARGIWQPQIFSGTFQERKQAVERWLNRVRSERVSPVVALTSSGVLRLFHHEKVNTGHFCELHFLQDSWKIQKWNEPPQGLVNVTA